MKTVVLSAVLPAEAITELSELANQGKRTARDFKSVTHRYRDHLLEHGIDADYLAYVLEWQLAQLNQN